MIRKLISNLIKSWIHKNEILERWYGISRHTKEFYSQFGEDASLQIYFKNLDWSREKKETPLTTGFYVDIGCYAPESISNTWWFYKNGWRGINVDLSKASMDIFENARPEDINVVAAITNIGEEKEIDFFEFGASSVFNTLDEENARHTIEVIGIQPQKRKIRALSLEILLDQYLPGGQKISFFSIDAEGHDLEILKSNNWKKYRPQAIVVEIHETNFFELSKNEIVGLLSNEGYQIYSWLNPSVIFTLK